MTTRFNGLGMVLALALVTGGCAAGKAFRQGESAMRAGSLDEAVAEYRKAVQAAPENPNYKIALQRAQLAASRAHLDRAHEYCRNHKWYETARLLTVNDLYSFDPNLQVELEEFTDIVGRNFRQPEEGLGFDDSPSAHMWRTINWPTRFL